ncbi:hypothetical protein G9A89_012570 [Geosiphon pyriformis]|nr:hypothetical protein G9A89_012570 [Geosiphon pyriformis]
MDQMMAFETVFAIHSFEAENPDEVPFEVGEPIIVLEKDEMFGDGWWQGQNIHGQTGLFPMNYTTPENPHIPYLETKIHPQMLEQEEDHQRYSNSSFQSPEILPIPFADGHQNNIYFRPISQQLPFASKLLSPPRPKSSEWNSSHKDKLNYQISNINVPNHINIQDLISSGNLNVSVSRSSSKKSTTSTVNDEELNDFEGRLKNMVLRQESRFQKEMQENIQKSSNEHLEEELQLEYSLEKTEMSQSELHKENEQEAFTPQEIYQLQASSDPSSSNFSITNDTTSSGESSSLTTATSNSSKSGQRIGSDVIEQHKQLKEKKDQNSSQEEEEKQELIEVPQKQELTEQKSDDEKNQGELSRTMSTSSAISKYSNHERKSFAPSMIDNHPLAWDVDQVGSWLHEQGFEILISQFIENDITGDVLLDLDLITLKELNIKSLGKRFKIMNAIAELKTQYNILDDQKSQYAPTENRSSFASTHRPDSQISTTTINSNRPTSYRTSSVYSQSKNKNNSNLMGFPARNSIIIASSSSKHKASNGKLNKNGGSLRDQTLKQQQERQHRREAQKIQNEEERQSHLERMKQDQNELEQPHAREHFEQQQLNQPYQQQQIPSRPPRPHSPQNLTTNMYNTPPAVFSNNSNAILEHGEFTMNKKTYSIIPDLPSDEAFEVKDRFTDVSSVYTNIFASGPNNSKNKARARILSRLGYFATDDKTLSTSPDFPSLMRSPSTRGWDFLLEEEEDAIKELERIEIEMESQRDTRSRNKVSNSQALVKVNGSARKRLHAVAPVPPKKNIQDRNSVFGNQSNSSHGQYSRELGNFKREPGVPLKMNPPSISHSNFDDGRMSRTDDEILGFIGVPDHEGWLKKQGEKYKTWKNRFCILKGVHLYYLKSDKLGNFGSKDTGIRGRINLTGYKIIPDENIYPGKYGFRAVHETERVYFFAHDDAEKTKEWMKAMMKATITRDMTAPVISSCNIPTLPLAAAQKLNPRPSFTRPSSVSSEYQQNAARTLGPSSMVYSRSLSPTGTTYNHSLPPPSHQSNMSLNNYIYQSENPNLPPIAVTDHSGYNASGKASQLRPVVMWHGMGDSCCNAESMGKIKEFIEKSLPGIYVHSIRLGSDEKEDRKAGFFGNAKDQVEEVCKILQADEKLHRGFNALGFSQGGLFLRNYVQRCNNPPVHNLITFGSPHQGISDIPGCENNDVWCQLMRSIARRGVYSNYAQTHVIQAQYYKDPERLDLYKERNVYLPDINNELDVKNSTYKKNLASLNALVLIRFTQDVTLKPKDTAWFSFYNEDGDLEPLCDTPLYKQDWIGLKILNEDARLVFKEIEGGHMQISLEYLLEEVITPYLSDPLSPEFKSGTKLTIQISKQHWEFQMN